MKWQKFIIGTLFLISLFGCSHNFYTARSLKTHSVKDIQLYVDTSLMLQDTPHDIGLVVVTENNDTLKSKGLLKGKLSWKNFNVNAEGAKFSNGKLTILKTDSSHYIPYIPVRFTSIFEDGKPFFDTIPLNYETAIEIFSTKAFKASPGSEISIGMNITYNNGETKTYKNIHKIKNFDDYYDVLLRASSYYKSEFTINSDPLDIPEHKSGIMIRSKFNHDLNDVFEVDVDYRNNYKYYANGRGGLFGFSGSNGSNGGVGSAGRNGQDGQDGEFGSSGDGLDIYLDAYTDSILKKTMVKAFIGNVNTKKTKRFLIDPDGGSLYVSAIGGSGGDGGSGGNGGAGGAGQDGEFYTEIIKEIVIQKDTAGREIKTEVQRTITRQRQGENGGNGGDGGFGGYGGHGGSGGYVIVYYTNTAQPFLKLLNINVSGGSGGNGGLGGNGGNGGNGGRGTPNGRNGRSGRNAPSGSYGYSGDRGRIEYKPTNEFFW